MSDTNMKNFQEAITKYEQAYRDYFSRLQFNDNGLYREQIIMNYTGRPIYVQGCDGKTHTIQTTPAPIIIDKYLYHPVENRVTIRIRARSGKPIFKTNTIEEQHTGKILELTIPLETLIKEQVYCKEINSFISINEIPDGMHLQTKAAMDSLYETSNTIGGMLMEKKFKDNMFLVSANCSDITYPCDSLYAMINDIMCQVQITKDPTKKDEVAIAYTDVNGTSGFKHSWNFYDVVNSDGPMMIHRPISYSTASDKDEIINYEKFDFFINTDPGKLRKMYTKYKGDNCSFHQYRESIQGQIELEYKTKAIEANTQLAKFKQLLSQKDDEITVLNQKLFASREYDLRMKELESRETRLEAAAFLSEQKIKKETISTIGTALKTSAVIIPICMSIAVWIFKKK